MKFALLLLLSPLAVSSFTSLCPQQPNSVVVNCNNQNPYQNPFFPTVPTIPGTRGRDLNGGYRRASPAAASNLEFQLRRRSDSSEESRERDDSRERENSSESDESSEEINDHRIPSETINSHRIPYYSSHHGSHQYPQVPSMHATTTVDSKLDFLRSGGGGSRNNFRRYYVPGKSTRDNLNVMPVSTVNVDPTHGHGHSGQYNHDAHSEGHGIHRGHNHQHNHNQLPSYIDFPTYITRPGNVLSVAHIAPEPVFPIEQILGSVTGDIVVNNRGEGAIIRPIPESSTGQLSQGVGLHHDTHESLILTRRGFRALEPLEPSKTFDMNPQDLLSHIITTISLPTVNQDGLNTEVNCDTVPLISQVPLYPQTGNLAVQTTLNGGAIPTVSETGMLSPDAQSSSTLTTTENMSGQANAGQIIGDTTVTKVTTTKVEELPTRIPLEVSSSGTTVNKVTTTMVEERPSVGTVIQPTQTGSTVTTVTTTKTEEGRPVTTNFVVPNEPAMPEVTAPLVSKVTTTTVNRERPITTDTIRETIQETPILTSSSSGSTITKVTTTKNEGQPIIADITIPESVVYETPTQSGGSTVTKVTTTTTTSENGPITTMLQPEEVVVDGGEIVRETEIVPLPDDVDVIGGDASVIDASPFGRLARPVRDGTYQYDSYRQRSYPLVYGMH